MNHIFLDLLVISLIGVTTAAITLEVKFQYFIILTKYKFQSKQPRKIRMSEIRYNLNKNLLKFTFGTANATHTGEVWIDILSDLDNIQLFIQLDPYDNNEQNGNVRMKYTIDCCRIDADKSGNWFANIAMNEIKSGINTDAFKCPLQTGKYLLHSPSLIEKEAIVNVPAFLPQVMKMSFVETLKARVKGKLVELFILSRVLETAN
jgi:hypothetical protein